MLPVNHIKIDLDGPGFLPKRNDERLFPHLNANSRFSLKLLPEVDFGCVDDVILLSIIKG